MTAPVTAPVTVRTWFRLQRAALWRTHMGLAKDIDWIATAIVDHADPWRGLDTIPLTPYAVLLADVEAYETREGAYRAVEYLFRRQGLIHRLGRGLLE